MTCELITGHAGAAHVSSTDAGWYNAGTIGAGKYVFDTGTQFAANVQSANVVQIGVGDALFEGRHVRVSATENVSIDNGAQGVNRNDIICIKYEYNSGTDVETASLAVIKGSAVSGTPTDPTIPSGSILAGASTAYMPLWRIPISGITVGTPEKLYGDTLLPLYGIASTTWAASQIPNLPASKITSGTFDAARIPSLDASKIGSGTLNAARVPNLDASKVASGTLADARIPNLNTSKLTAGTLGAARGGTGKTYGFAWQQIKTWTGTAQQSWSKGSYSEFMIVARHGTDYLGSVILPSAHIDTTKREVYLTGSYNGTSYNGRGFAAFLTSTTAQVAIANVDGSNVMSSTTWWIYGR